MAALVSTALQAHQTLSSQWSLCISARTSTGRSVCAQMLNALLNKVNVVVAKCRNVRVPVVIRVESPLRSQCCHGLLIGVLVCGSPESLVR